MVLEHHPEALSTRSIAEIVKKYARSIGLDADQFGAHSLRAGFITSAAKYGAGLFKSRPPTGYNDLGRTPREPPKPGLY